MIPLSEYEDAQRKLEAAQLHVDKLKPSFEIEDHSTIDKSFAINGPDDLRLFVDFDDVHHKRVDKLAELAVSALNAYWANTSARTVIEREVDYAERVCASCGKAQDSGSPHSDELMMDGKCPDCGGDF